MLRIIWIILRGFVSMLRRQCALVVEIIALRQQRATFRARNRQPRVRTADRVFWVVLRRVWARWADALVIVKPETVIRHGA
jgi:hypothetical protein